MNRSSYFLLIAMMMISVAAKSQNKNTAYVDANGILRWSKSKEEIKGFGENYTLPFAYAYRNAKKMNLDPEKLIDEDVYHFARLGFDLYRVHVWDCEISDTLGNLLSNEHLRLFDYLIMKLKERGIRAVITPIAYWGNGWPEPDEKTPGFSAKYGKDACLTNPEAIKAQENYLYQFLNHVNPYTKLAYKDDDDIIAFEISNEPHHRESADSVKTFINRMVKSMRKTGCKKPILYNISHSIFSADAYFNSMIQGGTFQWYPTGLGSQHELGGNLLPNVDQYTIPYTSHPKFKKQAKIVYEFDAADVGRSYMYPAMARSFREAGLQIATHFAYDPTYSAYANTEYGTHYMNLLYTPKKALALKIASEIFHRIPLYEKHGGYPSDTLFGPFRISSSEDLAEMITNESFIYTNHTSSQPTHPEQLKQIAGWGNSTLVQYKGTGAYFLDKLADGIWRLEILPDVNWINDPFGKTSLDKKIAVLNKRNWPITIHLPDLGTDYFVSVVNRDAITANTKASGSLFTAAPGVYILSKEKNPAGLSPQQKTGFIFLYETTTVSATTNETYVLHQPVKEAVSGQTLVITATVVSAQAPEKVEAFVQTPGSWFEPLQMQQNGYQYSATLPASKTKEGYIQYYIIVTQNGKTVTYPGAIEKSPRQWDFYGKDVYSIPVVNASNPVWLFSAATDFRELSREWRRGSVLLPLQQPGNAELVIHTNSLITTDPEEPSKEQPADYSMRYYFREKVKERFATISNKTKLVVKARSSVNKICPLQVALITKHGAAYGATIQLDTVRHEYTIEINSLKQVPLVTLPRPYPGFVPYFFYHPQAPVFDLKDIESIQLSIGPGIPKEQWKEEWGFAIESIWLQ